MNQAAEHLMSRRARFRAACALARVTMRQWAQEHDVTVSHLNQVLRGERQSHKLIAIVDAFIAKQLEPPTSAGSPSVAA